MTKDAFLNRLFKHIRSPILWISLAVFLFAFILAIGRSNKNIPLKNEDIFECVAMGDNACVRRFSKRGSNINIADENGFFLIHIAVIANNYSTVSLLIKEGASVDVVDRFGQTPLHMAKGRKMIEKISRHIIINKNFRDYILGFTPLHVFAFSGAKNDFCYFLNNGGSPNIKDYKGNTPVYYAKEKNLLPCKKFVPAQKVVAPEKVRMKAPDVNATKKGEEK